MKDVYESPSEAAEAIGTSPKTITGWIKDGRLRAERIRRAGKPSFRIRHADMVEASRGTMFEQPDVLPQMLFDSLGEQLKAALSLEVVWPSEQRSEIFSVDSVMAGFKTFKALTYTVSVPAIMKLLTMQDFDSVEVVFGNEPLVRQAGAGKVMVEQGVIEDAVALGYIAVGGDTDPRTEHLMAWFAEGRLRLHAASGGVIHSKLYFLERPGLRRVLVGSANLSARALLSGRQGEVLLAYDNDAWMWELMLRKYEAVLSLCAPLQLKARIKEAHLIVAEDLPAGRQAGKAEEEAATIYTFAPTDMPGDPEYLAARAEEIYGNMSEGLRENIKSLPNGTAVLHKASLRRINYAAAPKRADDPAKLHRLDRADGRFIYDGRPVERPVAQEGIEHDALLLTQFMDKFREFGEGSDILQRNYWGLWGWLYFSTFMSELARKLYVLGGNASKELKHVAIVYGQSNCGKSALVKFLLTSMFGPPATFDDSCFTQSDFKARVTRVGTLPIYYEDVSGSRFAGRNQNQGEIIVKYYDQLVSRTSQYPCVIVTANADASQFSNEVRNRAFPVFTPKGIASDDDETRRRLDKEALPLLNRVRQDFYWEYLHRMANVLADTQDPTGFDYIWESTNLIRDILIENLRTDEVLPSWARAVTTSEFNAQAWELKHREMAKKLTRQLYTPTFPPQPPFWTLHDGDIVIGVESVRDTMRGKEFQDHWVKREAKYGDKLVTLHREAVVKSIQRTDATWKLPLPLLQRLASALRRKAA